MAMNLLLQNGMAQSSATLSTKRGSSLTGALTAIVNGHKQKHIDQLHPERQGLSFIVAQQRYWR